MVEYIEGCHRGGFLTGSLADVAANVKDRQKEEGYQNPTYTWPASPEGAYCACERLGCESCENTQKWLAKYALEVDDLLLRSNVHTCIDKYCKYNKTGRCRARMPREVRRETKVDPKTGALRFKHEEPNMNDICALITFLFRCNHDCTCLLSGSAVNHIVYYITEYITKMGPPTHTVFDAIKSVFDRGQDILSCAPPNDKGG
ncbi:uncharacterized protein SCHCODRAFT_02668858 [Schizophyllum commune H4-8]|nr:uncharacterized protein SCHCODRAFT_02668858 [Schizophyllum commune H4-8]KAI5891530.1 hypothetical protein SCHCODRAFT_02668858 [Schizophyllum commune H4-8]